jgi:hypothetical protein
MGSCGGCLTIKRFQERNPGAHVDARRFKGSDFRETTNGVLTLWHAGCTFIASQTRTGAIPEAESQQNADGFDASLDCRRSALNKHRIGCSNSTADWATSLQRTSRRGAPIRTRSSTPTLPSFDGNRSRCSHTAELEAALNERAAGGPCVPLHQMFLHVRLQFLCASGDDGVCLPLRPVCEKRRNRY